MNNVTHDLGRAVQARNTELLNSQGKPHNIIIMLVYVQLPGIVETLYLDNT